jgi:hypothetical protein
MIRDPSDGSVKEPRAQNAGKSDNKENPAIPANGLAACTENNWGLKSLDREPRKPTPAPTADELREHYGKFNLGFQPKENEEN